MKNYCNCPHIKGRKHRTMSVYIDYQGAAAVKLQLGSSPELWLQNHLFNQ